MSSVNHILFISGVLLFASILIGHVSRRFGLPLLFVFLLIGMLAGEDGPGGIVFNNFGLSFLVANLALAVILLDGGLRTELRTFRVALRPALSLATIGVVLTAALMGLATKWLLQWDWRYALLLGAIVASTDAAAVFALLRDSGTRLNDRVAATLEIESGLNDPMAVFLTVVLIELIRSNADAPGLVVLLDLARQFGLGAAIGLAGGYLLSEVVQVVRVGEGLHALLLMAGGLLLFAGCNLLGGSGFLAVYLVGLLVGNRRLPGGENLLRAMDGLAWLAQAGMFLLLGLLVTPSRLADLGWSALLLSLALIVLARPLAVALTLAPFRFPMREVAYVSWVGLRGAVPIVLAIFPTIAGIDQYTRYFDVAFFVVLVSLVVQGSTVASAARLLGLALPAQRELRAHGEVELGAHARMQLLEVQVPIDWPLIGVRVAALPLPTGSRVLSGWRNAKLMNAVHGESLMAGDTLLLIAPPNARAALGELFSRDLSGGAIQRRLFGDFELDPSVSLGEIEQVYGVALVRQERERALAVGQWLGEQLHRRPVQGDRVRVGPLELIVRETQGARVARVGLRIGRARS
ncbi:MAG TPA: potassium/proton antiporter [Burkholderiales bacterium]|nr:potassium/proton antiporter [Burkholderiales bacterium]